MLYYFPVAIVATLIAFFYGRAIHHAWLPALITFVCTLLGGLLFKEVGQIAAVILSAFLIFFFFTRPTLKKAAAEAAARERDPNLRPNEEDM